MHDLSTHLLLVHMGTLPTALFRGITWQMTLRRCLGTPSLLIPLTTLPFPGENNDNEALRIISAAQIPSFPVSYL